jgi:hemolysin activation/secretion protein
MRSISVGSSSLLNGKLESINVVGTRRLNSNYVRSRLADSTPGPLNEQRMRSAMQLQQHSPEVANISAELQVGSRPGFNLL